MASLMPNGKQQYFDANGDPLSGGKVYTYAAGTATPKATYADPLGAVPNANPVILDGRGEALIFWSGAYKAVVKDSLDNTIWSVDGMSDLQTGLAASNGASMVGFLQAGASAVARTIQDKARDVVSVFDFMTAVQIADVIARTLLIDVTAAIQAAINSGAKSIFFPAGDYLVSSTITIQANYTSLIGAGHGASRLIASADGVSVLLMASASPTTTMLQHCLIRDLGFKVALSVTSITSGVGVQMTNCQQCKFLNVQVEGFFGCWLVEGGGINFFEGMTLNTGYNFGAYRAGSYCLKTIAHNLGGGSYKNPAGMVFNNFDIWNGNSTGYLDYGVIIESCDGFWFSAGHIGFAKTSCLYVHPTVTGVGQVWVIGLSFQQVHFDGAGGLSQYCVLYDIPGGFVGSVNRHTYSACHMGNAGTDCILINSTLLRDIDISGCRVNLASSSAWGIVIQEAVACSVVGTVIDGNGASGITGGGVLIDGADFCKVDAIFDTLPIGMKITNAATRNNLEGIFRSCTDDVDTTGLSNNTNSVSGSTTNATYAVASASNVALPLPHITFSITGTTTINTIDAADTLLFRRVTLLFTGVCAVTDGTIKLAGAFTSSAGSSLSLIYDGTNWVETSRAIV